MSEFPPLMVSSLAYVLAGFVVGLVVSLTGVGGTVLMKRTPDRIIRSLLSILLACAGLKLIAI